MKEVTIEEQKFDDLMSKINQVTMEKDNYIPSEEDIFNYIEKYPEKYYLYLLWFSEHKPQPQTEAEKAALKQISKIINTTVCITVHNHEKTELDTAGFIRAEENDKRAPA